MLYVLVVLLLLNSNDLIDTKIHNRIPKGRSFVSAVFSNNTSGYNLSNTHRGGVCRWLRGLKHQNKQCRKRKGLSDILLEARELAVNGCKEQFQYDTWNCNYQRNISKKVYRETAFLYSLTTSALTHSIARACSDGKLLNCHCDNVKRKESLPSRWKWGGCGDNVRDAAKITRRFLQMKESGDWPSEVLNYNNEVGITAVAESETRVCACHGASGSCMMKTCWKRVSHFTKIAEKLKSAYHNAIKINPGNKISNLSTLKSDKPPGTLLYLAHSPNFCHGTSGRRCKDVHNCATLCCGRGFRENLEIVKERCNCRWRSCCFPDLKCDECEEEKVINICK